MNEGLTPDRIRAILGPGLDSTANVRLFAEYWTDLQSRLRTKRAYARQLRGNLTATELEFWDALKDCRGRFRQQEALFGYVLDYYSRSSCVAVELDGGYHGYADQELKDAIRDLNLEKIGITTIRIPASVVDSPGLMAQTLADIEGVVRLRQRMFRQLNIRQPTRFARTKALKYGFVRWLDTQRPAVGWDNTLLF